MNTVGPFRTDPVSFEATVAEARALVARLSYLLDRAENGPAIAEGSVKVTARYKGERRLANTCATLASAIRSVTRRSA